MSDTTVRLEIQRGDPDHAAWSEAFDVPHQDGMSVLDALIWIRTHRDGSLAVRYSCTSANACKECMLLVDGKVAYACMARLEPGGASIAPLPNKPLVRDLVTDIVPPGEKLANALATKRR